MYPSPNANKSPHHSPPNTYNIIESNNHCTTNPNPPPPHHEAPLNHRPPPNLPLHNHHTRKPELLHQIRTPPVHRRRRNDLQRQLDHEPRLRKPSKQRTTTLRKRRDIDFTNETRKANRQIPSLQQQVIDDFLLVHRPSNTDNGWEPVRKVTNNFVNTTAGAQSTTWKVPALKDDG